MTNTIAFPARRFRVAARRPRAWSFWHSRNVRGVRFCDGTKRNRHPTARGRKVNCFRRLRDTRRCPDDTPGVPSFSRVRTMKYRADIDGLRALAVIPVLFYHVGVPGFSGGFVGVDIFFVISGYLICGMIDADIRNGSFSLANFYKRRILRILPALFRHVPGHQRAGLGLLPAGRARGLFQEPRERGRFDFECLLRGDGRIFRRARRNEAAVCIPGRWASRSSSISSPRC